MSADLETLRKLLAKSRSKAAARICSDPPARLEKGDFAKIENAILSHQDTGDNVGELLDLVRQRALQAKTDPKVLNQSRIVIRYRAPQNPFAAKEDQAPRVRIAEQHVKDAAAWLLATRKAETATLAFYRFLVSIILEFRVLHQDYVPAILRSLSEERTVPVHSRLEAIPLSLAYGRQQNAERRLLILRKKSLRHFRDFSKVTSRKQFLQEAVADEVKVDTLLQRLRRAAANEAVGLDPRCEPPGISKLIEHARVLAMLHLPSVMVAHRSRLIVSHSIPPEVLGRIMGLKLDPFPLKQRHLRAVVDNPEEFEPAQSHDEPIWMADLRQALGQKALVNSILDKLATGEEMIPRLLAEFARFLHMSKHPQKAKGCKAGTVRRYCLLIALRLIPRLNSPIEEVTADAWEDAIEQLLDEDAFYNLKSYSANPSSSAQSHSRALVTAIRHWLRFLKHRHDATKEGPELGDLESRLPVLGLVAVDASLITVDEYRDALGTMVDKYAPKDADECEAGRVALILGYRCGLRRNEAAGLCVSDFDSADHLHVRANEMRSLKTSNARRDLPLRLLMPQDEFAHVQRRVTEIKLRADSANLPYEEAYLFSMRNAPSEVMDFEKVVERIHWAFRGDPKFCRSSIDETFHYHRLRHSFCNLMLLKLWPGLGEKVIEFFGDKIALTKEWIQSSAFRRELFGTDLITRGDLQGIALLMGHGSAAISLEHYIHVLDFYEEPPRSRAKAKFSE